MCGDDGKKVTPVPMPNTEVKLLSADGSEGFPFVRVGRCHANTKDIIFGWCLFFDVYSILNGSSSNKANSRMNGCACKSPGTFLRLKS